MHDQMAVTESKYCDFFIRKIWILCGWAIFNQTIWDKTVGNLSWYLQNYVGQNVAKGALVLGELGQMGEKTHNVTSDVDYSFSTTVNNKPLWIKLKQKRFPKEENTIYIKKDDYGSAFTWDLQNSTRVGSKMLWRGRYRLVSLEMFRNFSNKYSILKK